LIAALSLSVHSATTFALISFMYNMNAFRGFFMWGFFLSIYGSWNERKIFKSGIGYISDEIMSSAIKKIHYLGYYCFEQYHGAWNRLSTKSFYYGRYAAWKKKRSLIRRNTSYRVPLVYGILSKWVSINIKCQVWYTYYALHTNSILTRKPKQNNNPTIWVYTRTYSPQRYKILKFSKTRLQSLFFKSNLSEDRFMGLCFFL